METPNTEKINCPNCGTGNKPDFKYCINCGYELPKANTENLTASEPPVQQANTNTGRKRLLVLGIIGGVFWLGLIIGILVFLQQHYSINTLPGKLFEKINAINKPPISDVNLSEIADTINKTCPMKLDEETQLDSVVAMPGKVLGYYFTLVNTEKATFDIAQFKELIESRITGMVKTNPATKVLRDNKTTFNYYYKDKNGEDLFNFSITPEKYEP